MEKITCRQENTMPLKDGEAPKLHPKMPNVTSETHNSSSIAVAAAMHFGYLFLPAAAQTFAAAAAGRRSPKIAPRKCLT